MKIHIMRFIDYKKEFYDNMAYLLMLPLLFSVTNIYSALCALSVIISVFLLNLGLGFFFRKIQLDHWFAISLILSASICAVYSKGFILILENSTEICYSSILFAQTVSYLFNGEERNFVKELKFYWSSILKFWVPIAAISFIRELLNTGSIFTGFTENGIKLLPKTFGDYFNTAAGVLLIISGMMIILSMVMFKNKIYLAKPKREHFEIYLTGWILSAFLISIIFILKNVSIIDPILYLLPFIICAAIVFIVSYFYKTKQISIIFLISLWIVCNTLSNASNFVESLILWLTYGIISLLLYTYISITNKGNRISLIDLTRVLILLTVLLHVAQVFF